MEKYDCLKLENQLCFPLYAAARKVIGQYRDFLDAIGLTYTQYVTMMVLWEERCVSVKELGKRLYLDSGTLTPLLKAMEKNGLVRRSRCKDDERVVEISLTEKGEKLREEAVNIPARVATCVRLDPNEASTLYTLLHKLLDSMNTEEDGK